MIPLDRKQCKRRNDVRSSSRPDRNLERLRTAPAQNTLRILVQRKRDGRADKRDRCAHDPYDRQRIRKVSEGDDLGQDRSQRREEDAAEDSLFQVGERVMSIMREVVEGRKKGAYRCQSEEQQHAIRFGNDPYAETGHARQEAHKRSHIDPTWKACERRLMGPGSQ